MAGRLNQLESLLRELSLTAGERDRDRIQEALAQVRRLWHSQSCR